MVAKDILAQGEWPFPPLACLTEVPVIRPDGSLVLQPGYDGQTCLLYKPPPGLAIPPIPENPTVAEVRAATALLSEAICDFPFDLPASRSNALALILTPIVRPSITGNVPMAVIDAPKAAHLLT